MKKTFVVHPFLFAIFPILFLFSHNIYQLLFSQTLPLMAVVFGFTLLLVLLLGFILRDTKKAGVIVSIFLVLFFSYAAVYSLIRGWGGNFGIVGHRYLVLALGILLTCGAYVIIKTRRNLHNFTNILNVVAVSLVMISLSHIVAYELKTKTVWQVNQGAKNIATHPIDLANPDTLPDIYHIILDGYARGDILEEIYHHNNIEFLDYLTQKGFYIAKNSRSNYNQTTASLASSLNLQYIHLLIDQLDVNSPNRRLLGKMIKDNVTFRFLKQYGYIVVAFSSGYSFTKLKDADIYMAPVWRLDEFGNALLMSTPLPYVLGKPISLKRNPNKPARYNLYHLHRERILYTFDRLANLPKRRAPSFVFAHIMAPHPPFVFGQHEDEINFERQFSLKDGSHLLGAGIMTRDEYVKGYREQLIFINQKVKAAIESILSNSTRPTIIILQGDHGPGSRFNQEDPNHTDLKERFSILNAFYLPHHNDGHFYDGITPVNTFRIILNRYFGTNLGLLKDQSYFAPWSRPYDFIHVTNKIN